MIHSSGIVNVSKSKLQRHYVEFRNLRILFSKLVLISVLIYMLVATEILGKIPVVKFVFWCPNSSNYCFPSRALWLYFADTKYLCRYQISFISSPSKLMLIRNWNKNKRWRANRLFNCYAIVHMNTFLQGYLPLGQKQLTETFLYNSYLQLMHNEESYLWAKVPWIFKFSVLSLYCD